MTRYFAIVAIQLLLVDRASAWFWQSDQSYTPKTYEDGLYSQSHRKYWIETKKNLRLHYLGCRWSHTSAGSEGCREDESEDGTVYWYQMANCRRAQVVYSLYGSDGSSESCQKHSFLDTFVTLSGLEEFATLMGTYGQNSPISYNDVYDLPQCEESADGDGSYEAVGCSSNGRFTIDKFSDKYCLQYEETVSDLSYINKKLQKISCYDCDTASDDGYDDNGSSSLCEWVLSESASCSPIDADICGNPTNGVLKKYSVNKYIDSDQSTRHGKYLIGSFLLGVSLILFLGVMMMNRRINEDFGNLRRKLRHKRKQQYWESGGIDRKLSKEMIDDQSQS